MLAYNQTYLTLSNDSQITKYKSQFANKLVVPNTKELEAVEQKTVLKENAEITESVRLLHKT